jgi:hypothetical protein
MADMTLCASKECPVRDRCRRNEACPTAYEWSSHRQSVAYWHPEAGAGCPGFIDAGRQALEAQP